MHGVLAQLRIGDMTLHAVHRQAPRQRAAATDLDGIADAVLAGGLTDDAPVDALAALAQRFDHTLGAVDRRAFLVAGNQKGECATVVGIRSDEILGGGDHGRESAFHVRGPAAVEQTVADRGLERIRVPFFERSGRNHVRMSGETQHRAGMAVSRPEIVDVAVAQLLDPKADARQSAGQEFLATLVGGRHGGAGDQFLGQFQRRGHGNSFAALRLGALYAGGAASATVDTNLSRKTVYHWRMSTEGLGHHISSHYNEDLERLRSSVLEMGGLVERQLTQAIGGITEPDARMIVRVAQEELQVNQLERSIDEDCSRILATRGPTASDLRLIITILKTITDLERIGDEGEKIAAIAARLALRERPDSRYREVRNLGELVIEMLHDTLDAFARLDTELALAVVRRDRTVDEEYEAIHRQSITFMMEDPRTIRRALDIMWVVRSLERIGDHAKNVCEYLIYLVHGKDVRHTKIEEIEKELHAFKG